MAEKVYTESEVKKLMRLAYDNGNNYAYYCTIYPHERKDNTFNLIDKANSGLLYNLMMMSYNSFTESTTMSSTILSP